MANLKDSEKINRAWENVKENIKTSARESSDMYELKQRNRKFEEECLVFLDHRKQAKVQRLHDPKQSNIDDLNNVRRQAS